jgi:L-alanine-DL-glutamate epimerase-like enolase superfamily enzyme
VNPHLCNDAIATAATVQGGASSPATTQIEWDVRANPLCQAADALLTDRGTVRVTDRPGLGIDLDTYQLMPYEEQQS